MSPVWAAANDRTRDERGIATLFILSGSGSRSGAFQRPTGWRSFNRHCLTPMPGRQNQKTMMSFGFGEGLGERPSAGWRLTIAVWFVPTDFVQTDSDWIHEISG